MANTYLPLKIVSALTVLLLFGSRWFSYIGVSPFFISDVLIAIAFVAWIFSARQRERGSIQVNEYRLEKPLLIAFVAWVFIRGLVSIASGYALLDILRDLVPFAYTLLAFLVASQISGISHKARQKLYLWLRSALGLHLVWSLAVLLSGDSGGFQLGSGFFEGGIFAFRPDIDTALVVIYFVLNLREWESGKRKTLSLIQMAACLAVVALSPARSSLLALLICMAWFLSSRAREETRNVQSKPKARKSRKTVFFFGALISVFALGFTSAGERLLSTFGLVSRESSSLASSALGTANARELVWTQVLDWVNSSTTTILLGSGFGINFLDVTQTLQFLEGTTYTGVRSPHNFLVTVIARLGWPAVVLLVTAIALIIMRNRKAAALDDLSFASMTIVLAFIPISILGVILEAPFGAIPFYFSLGVLLGSSAVTIVPKEESGK
jgi:hypothetical protein